MAGARTLRPRGERTRRKLLDAGIEVFGRRGLHSARVDDVVTVAETSHGTFYLYFANKEELFQALVLDVTATMTDLAESFGPLSPTAGGRADLRRWLVRFSEVHTRWAPVIRAWTEAGTGNRDLGRVGADVLSDFADALSRRIAESRAENLSPEIAALVVVALIERLHYYVLVGQVDAPPEVVVDTLAALVEASLFGAPAGP